MTTLDTIGRKTGTDKSSMHHGYLHVYESYLSQYRNAPISLIELGYGGYQFEDRGGEGARMWYEYFTNAKIVCIDLHNKVNAIKDRVEFWQGSQTDEHLLRTILERESRAPVRIVIDDASHASDLTIKTFEIIFPLLKSGDFYFVEDVHTSYWDKNGYNGNPVPGEGETTMNYFAYYAANLTHQLNAHAFDKKHHNEFADKIEFIHFYKELIVIKKL